MGEFIRPDGAVVRSAPAKSLSVEGKRSVVAAIRDFERFGKQVKTSGLRALARVVKGQTLERIEQTKTTPDGQRWRPWSPIYAATRSRSNSLLVDTRALLRSLTSISSGEGLLVGSPQPYAPHVQRVRPFLGLSKRNHAELQGTLDDWAKHKMGRRGYA